MTVLYPEELLCYAYTLSFPPMMYCGVVLSLCITPGVAPFHLLLLPLILLARNLGLTASLPSVPGGLSTFWATAYAQVEFFFQLLFSLHRKAAPTLSIFPTSLPT
jgi:ABC-type glycerol-3-phosphate transport system permease component